MELKTRRVADEYNSAKAILKVVECNLPVATPIYVRTPPARRRTSDEPHCRSAALPLPIPVSGTVVCPRNRLVRHPLARMDESFPETSKAAEAFTWAAFTRKMLEKNRP